MGVQVTDDTSPRKWQTLYYVDVAGPSAGGSTRSSRTQHKVNELTFKTYSATQAGEIAIALALTNPKSKHIITDSRGAFWKYELGGGGETFIAQYD